MPINVLSNSDQELLELLQANGPSDVIQLAEHLQVTPTAVRQRMAKLLAWGLVERQVVRHGRGRPRFQYRLTNEGLRALGSNFADLAIALWQELSQLEDRELQHRILRKVIRALANRYSAEIRGITTRERMEAISKLLRQRRVPFSVEKNNGLPVLTAHACPYPELAEMDRAICVIEQLLFSELVGQDMELLECRLDGGHSCRFKPGH